MLIVSDGAGSGDGSPVFDSVTYEFPKVEYVFGGANARLCANVTPAAQASLNASVDGTAPVGTVVITSDQYNVVDEADDTHTYSFATPQQYFSVNGSTGEVTTLAAAIPAGDYQLDVVITDAYGATVTIAINVTVNGEAVVAPVSGPASSLASTGASVPVAILLAIAMLALASLVAWRLSVKH